MIELTTKEAIEHLVRQGNSKYRISKLLGVQPIMVHHYSRGSARMSTVNANKMMQLFSIFITDTYKKKQADDTI